MRIGVLSDTHGHLTAARKALNQMGEIDLLLHAGDYYDDAQRLMTELQIPVRAVCGNCDYFSSGLKEEIIPVGNQRLYLTHGHIFRVKNSYLNLYYKAKEIEADVVVFGHTHVPTCECVEDVIIFNPGSIAFPRRGSATFGLIIYEQDQLQTHIRSLNE